ncbi:hypothetical protein D9M68_775930 [compost metagenome]
MTRSKRRRLRQVLFKYGSSDVAILGPTCYVQNRLPSILVIERGLRDFLIGLFHSECTGKSDPDRKLVEQSALRCFQNGRIESLHSAQGLDVFFPNNILRGTEHNDAFVVGD